MHRILQEIISKTKEDLLKRKKKTSELRDSSLTRESTGFSPTQNDNPFYKFIQSTKDGTVAIIAEIKFASPTESNLGSQGQLLERVKQYEQAGADAISIVTEKHFFKGDPTFIKRIKDFTSLPVLQKDFVIDEYQIHEAKSLGADAILLIARILSEKDLISLVNLSKKIDLEPVVEINSDDDLRKALKTKTEMIAANARDLDTFEVDVGLACELLKRIPKKFIKLGFSGIHSRIEVEKYKQAGVKAVLVGTELMKTKNINKFIRELKNVS